MRLVNILFLVVGLTMASATFAQNLGERLKGHVEVLASDSLEGRGLGTSGKDKATQYIVREMIDMGLESLKEDYRHSFQFRSNLAWIPATNLVGVIRGSDPVLRDEYIVVGAHYDHLGYSLSKNNERVVYPGADDNASGVAAMLEIARRLKGEGKNLKRSIVFVAFDAEESGLIGAERFLTDSLLSARAIKLMFSLDMVGMYSTHGGLDIKGIESLVSGGKWAGEIAAANSIRLKKMGSEIEARTDTKPFGDRGIPAAHVFTGLKSPYHKPGDKAGLLDYEGMEKVVYFMEAFVVSLSNQTMLEAAPSIAAISPAQPGKKRAAFHSGLVMNHGTGYHKYPEEFYRARNTYSFSGGLYGQWLLSPFFGFQAEALYDLNQSRMASGTFRRHSVTLPVNLQVSTPTASSGFRLYVFAGAYYRYHFDATLPGSETVWGDNVRQDEWGYQVGVGLDIFKFTLAATSRRGLTEVLTTGGINPKIFNRNQYLTLGYRF
jgi:aminopeptidase YwaD